MPKARRLSIYFLTPLAALGCTARAQSPLPDEGAKGSAAMALVTPSSARAELVGPSGHLFKSATLGVGLSRHSLIQQDGSQANRNGVVGSWSLANGVQAGVGLFSVTADGRKHADTSRMPSSDSVAPKRQRIAALGLSLSF